jgi:predicted transposase/invertase (TIGR01784 family)
MPATEDATASSIGSSQVTKTHLQNPFSFAEFESDKEIVVDVHAREENDNEHQIEMQVQYHANLPRPVHDNRARLYQRQIGEGQRYVGLGKLPRGQPESGR